MPREGPLDPACPAFRALCLSFSLATRVGRAHREDSPHRYPPTVTVRILGGRCPSFLVLRVGQSEVCSAPSARSVPQHRAPFARGGSLLTDPSFTLRLPSQPSVRCSLLPWCSQEAPRKPPACTSNLASGFAPRVASYFPSKSSIPDLSGGHSPPPPPYVDL